MDTFRSFWGSPGRAPPPGELGSPPTARVRELSDEEGSDADDSGSRSVGPISIRAPPTDGGVGLTVGSPSSTVGSDRSFEDALERDANSSQVSYGSAGPFTPVGSYTAPSIGASDPGISSSQYGFLVEGAMHRLNQLADKAEGDTSLLQDCDEDEFQQRIAKIAEENGVTVDSPSMSSLVETLLPVVQEISRQTTPATTPGHATPAAPSAEGATSAAPEPTGNMESPLFRLSVRNAQQEKDSGPSLGTSANIVTGSVVAPSAAGLRVVTEVTIPSVVSASSVKEVTLPGAEVALPPRAAVSEVEVQSEEEEVKVQPEEDDVEVQPEEEDVEVQPEEEEVEVQREEKDSGDYVEVDTEGLQAGGQEGGERQAPEAQKKEEDHDEAEVKGSPEEPSVTAKESQESVPEEEDIKIAVVEAPAPAPQEEEPSQVQAPIARIEEEEVEKRVQQEQQQAFEALAQPPRAPMSAQEEGPEEEEFQDGEEGEEGEYEEYEEDGEEYEEAEEDEDIDGAFEQLAAQGLSPEILRAIQQAQRQGAAAAQAAQSNQAAQPNQSQAPAGLGSGGVGLGSGAGLGPRAGSGGAGSGSGPAGLGSGSGPAGLGSGAAGLRSGSGSGAAGSGSGSGSGAAGLGSGAGLGPALPPRPAAGAARPAQQRAVEVIPPPEEDEDLSDEQKAVKAKVRDLRMKLLRLALRVGHTHRSGIVAQVLYRIELAEQRQMGRGMLNRSGMNFDRIAAMAQELEAKEGFDTPLDLHIKLLFLGKTGVGKSATINNIFQQPIQSSNAFEPETKSIRVLDFNMYGIKITVIDTPGLGLGDGAEEANDKKMEKVERICEKMKPDVVFYVDRLDNQGRDFQDCTAIDAISKALGEEIWFNAIVLFTHAAAAPPDGSNGQPINYETYVSQRSAGVQQSIRRTLEDERVMNPVCLVENHPGCRTNRAGEKILPNGMVWRPQLLLLAFASKILNQANDVMKLQDDARAQQEDQKYGNMMPLLTGLMAEAREIKTRKIWVSQAEKEAQKQHEALRKRIIDLEQEIHQLETSLAKEKDNDDVLDFDNKLAPVMAQRARKESYLMGLKTTLDLEKTRLYKNPFSESAMKRIRAEMEEEQRILAERRRKVKYVSQGGGRRRHRALGGGTRHTNTFWDEDEGSVADTLEPDPHTNFAIWADELSAPYDRAGYEPGPLEWGLQEVPPLLDDRLMVELGGKIQKEPKLLHASAEIKYTYHVSPVVNFRGDIDIDWLNQEGATFTFTADTSKSDMEKPPVAGVAVFMAKRKGAAGLKLAKIFTLKKLHNKDAPSAQRELRLSTVGGIVRSFEGEVARGLNVGMSTINPLTKEKGRHKIAFNASDFRGDFGFGVSAESEGYKVAGIMLGVNANMDSSGQGKVGLAFHSDKKIWPAAIMLITGLKILLQRWAQPGPMEMGEF